MNHLGLALGIIGFVMCLIPAIVNKSKFAIGSAYFTGLVLIANIIVYCLPK